MSETKQKTSRLGRGLSALIGEVEGAQPVDNKEENETPSQAGIRVLALKQIKPNPAQPRRTFDEAALSELAESIRAKGVLQAILVRPHPRASDQFQIIAGERRWRAAERAGLSEIPAIVRDLDELELLEVGIIENVQRTDLNPIEEAEAYGALMKRFGRTQEGLAESVGKSRAHIANTLRLLNLPENAREYLREGKLSAGHARAALGAADPETLVEQAVSKGLSVRDVEALARKSRDPQPMEYKSATPPGKDVDTEALEADLSRKLGLAVSIKEKAKGGELRISYGSLEQLDDLCRRLTARS